jgi:hypothetical protein
MDHMPKFIPNGVNSGQQVCHVVLLILVYLIPSVQAMLPADDPDMWWRFRTGQWIVQNHSAPVEDYFSTYAMGKPWIEYSWLFDLLLYLFYAAVGLPGVVYFVVGMALLITFVVHRLVRQFGLPLPAEIALVGAAVSAMKPLMTPRPWLFTIVFFAIELLIIAHVRHSGKLRLLWVLPFMFAIWANLHIQFVYGLGVLGLLLAEAVLVYASPWARATFLAPALSPQRLTLVFLACFAVTFLTPYHLLVYKQIFEYIDQTGVFLNVSELHPMLFRSPDSWLVLTLTITAAFFLGWRRQWLPFPTLLFLTGAMLAFRARRDAWFLAITAVWIIGDCSRALWHGCSFVFSRAQIAFSAFSLIVTLLIFSIFRQIFASSLQEIIAESFPVRAVDYVNAHQLPGPLFNDYDWGGFLVWSLPRLPVVIDGRLNLFGEERLERSLNTWNGYPGWKSDPDLAGARLVIGNKQRMLVSLLRSDPRFKIVYEDGIAAVFVAVDDPTDGRSLSRSKPKLNPRAVSQGAD